MSGPGAAPHPPGTLAQGFMPATFGVCDGVVAGVPAGALRGR